MSGRYRVHVLVLVPIVSCSACLNIVRNKKTLNFLFGERVPKSYFRF